MKKISLPDGFGAGCFGIVAISLGISISLITLGVWLA